MKNLILFGLSIILLSSCQEPASPRYFTDSPEIETVKSLIAAYENADWESFRSYYSDTARIFHNSTVPGKVSELIAGHKQNISQVSEYGLSDKNIFYEMIIADNGSRWVYVWSDWKGKLIANSQELIIPVHLAYKIQNGKCVREHGYWDNTPYLYALEEIEASKKKSK